MNNYLVTANDKAIVIDSEKDNNTEIERTKNLKKILKQENVIEEIEEEIAEADENINYYNDIKKTFKRYIKIYSLVGITGAAISILISGNVLLSMDEILFKLIVGPLFTDCFVFIVLYPLLTKSRKSAKNSQLEKYFLEPTLEEEKEKLEELKRSDKLIKSPKKGLKVTKIETKKELSNMRALLETIRWYGEAALVNKYKYDKSSLKYNEHEEFTEELIDNGIDPEQFEKSMVGYIKKEPSGIKRSITKGVPKI